MNDEFRVIYHEPICPDCGSFDIEAAEVDTGDGLTETAHICQALRHGLAAGLRHRLDHPGQHPATRTRHPARDKAVTPHAQDHQLPQPAEQPLPARGAFVRFHTHPGRSMPGGGAPNWPS